MRYTSLLSPYSKSARCSAAKFPWLESGLLPHRVLSHPDCARISPPPPPRCVLREVCKNHVSFFSFFFFSERTSRDVLRPGEEMGAIIGGEEANKQENIFFSFLFFFTSYTGIVDKISVGYCWGSSCLM